MGNDSSKFKKLEDDGGQDILSSASPIRPGPMAEPMFEGLIKGTTCNIKAITKYRMNEGDTTICWIQIQAENLVIYDSINSKKRKTFATWPLGACSSGTVWPPPSLSRL